MYRNKKGNRKKFDGSSLFPTNSLAKLLNVILLQSQIKINLLGGGNYE